MIKKVLKGLSELIYKDFPQFVNILLTVLLIVGMLLWKSNIDDWTVEKMQINEKWQSIVTALEPGVCILCKNGEVEPCHAPVLVDLASGEIKEVSIYTPHENLVAEIAPCEKQESGTFHLFTFAGRAGICDTDAHTCWIPLPQNEEIMDASLFCHNCRSAIAAVGTTGYALIDLRDVNAITAYPVEVDSAYTIRDYEVSVSPYAEINGIAIEIKGLLYN